MEPDSALSPSTTFRQRLKPWIELTRVHKFAGTMVLFWPFAWSLAFVARQSHMSLGRFCSLTLYGFVGACLLHSAGCIWNDIVDQDFDRQVERTKHRPLADRRISTNGALVFLSAHLTLLVAALWPLNQAAWHLGLVGIFFLPGAYPFMKRVTYWPQAWLGMAMNIGVPLASLAVNQTLSPYVGVLSVGCWSWTLWYDTIYACQDKKDDVNAGVKSTALLFASYTRLILTCFGSMVITSLLVSGFLSGAGPLFYGISAAGATFLLAKELYTVDLDNPKDCWATFHRNGFIFGAVVWSGLFADYLAGTHAVSPSLSLLL